MSDGDLDLDQRVRELYPPPTLPLEDYQYEKSVKHRRKRRSIYPSYMPELRILRHDIRRKYGEMFVNASNNRDIELMTRFFGEFVRPDCLIDRVTPKCNIYNNIYQICFSTTNSTPRGDNERFLHGFAMTCEMMPDHVLQLQECQVRTRHGAQGSIIVLKTLATCVKLFNPNSLQQQRNKNKLQHDHNDNQIVSKNSSFTPHTPPSDSSNESSQKLSGEIQLPLSPIINKASERYELTVVPNLVETVAAIVFIMILDENHFIRRFYIENKLISEKPCQ